MGGGGGGGGGNFGNQNFTQDTVVSPKYLFLNSRLLLLHPFPYLGSVHRVFNLHVLRSCASSIFIIAPSCVFLEHHSTSVSVFLSFGVHSLPSSMLSLVHLLQPFSPHGLAISVSLLLFVCHTCACSYFFCTDLLNPFYSHHPSSILDTVF